MDKSPEAFRTISEVADWLGTPAHVLRFWESRFSQVKPVKRAGGRRYYRPADMALLGGIKRLLHDDGMTIRSVQKLLRETGVKHVATFSPPLDLSADATNGPLLEGEAIAGFAHDVPTAPAENVIPLMPAGAEDADPDISVEEAERLIAPAASAGPAAAQTGEPEDTEAQFAASLEPQEAELPLADEAPPLVFSHRSRDVPAAANESADDAAPVLVAFGPDIAPEPDDPQGAPDANAPVPEAMMVARLLRRASRQTSKRGQGEVAGQYAALSARLTKLREQMQASDA